MIVELISIGDELLRGSTINTNAAFLSKLLFPLGLGPVRQTTVGDTPALLKEALKESLGRADCVITTGGLGPTLDDRTKEIASELFEMELVVDESLLQTFTKRYPAYSTANLHQAQVPQGASVLKNELGTAPGIVFQKNGKYLILLPGVPYEMRHIAENELVPWLQKTYQTKPVFQRRLSFMGLKEADVDPKLRELEIDYPSVSFGIYPILGCVEVFLSGHEQEVSACEEALRIAFPHDWFISPTGKLEEALHILLRNSPEKLSFAESCTGGRLASFLTQYPGSSSYLLGSSVSYSNDWKEKNLMVSHETLVKNGAVSREVALEMWQGICKITPCTLAASVTGIAGPDGGTPEKPVGTVWCAVGRSKEAPEVFLLNLSGTREVIMERTVRAIFTKLYKLLKKA